MSHTQEVGQLGENLAGAFLMKHGFKIIGKNYRRPWGEIDLIVQKGADLRFVEVKTVVRNVLRENDYEPEDNIHPWKRQRLRRIIETYLLQQKISEDLEWQVDVISVYLSPEGKLLKVESLEDVLL